MPSVPMLGWLGKQSQKAATRRVPSASPRKSPTSSPVERCPPEALLPDLSHPCESSDEHEAHKEFGPGLMHATQATQSEHTQLECDAWISECVASACVSTPRVASFEPLPVLLGRTRISQQRPREEAEACAHAARAAFLERQARRASRVTGPA